MVPSEHTPAFSHRERTPPAPSQTSAGARPSDMMRGAKDEAAEVGLLAAIAANRQLVHHLVECWNARDFDGYEAVLADDVDVELIPFETTLRGARTARAHAESQAVAFPDGKVVITDNARRRPMARCSSSSDGARTRARSSRRSRRSHQQAEAASCGIASCTTSRTVASGVCDSTMTPRR